MAVQAVSANSEPRKGRAVTATVVELMPNAAYRLQLESLNQVIAHVAGVKTADFVRLRMGDKVLVELSPHDKTRGRIVKLVRKN